MAEKLTTGVTEQKDEERVRSLTEKGQQLYTERVSKFRDLLSKQSESVRQIIHESETCSQDPPILASIKQNLLDNFTKYQDVFEDYCQFLHRQKTTESQNELELQQHEFDMLSNRVNIVSKNIQTTIDSDNIEIASRKSSKTSTKSSSSRKSQQKAEEAMTRLKIAQKAAELQRQKAKLIHQEEITKSKSKQEQEDLDTEIELLKYKEELEIANTRLRFEQELEGEIEHSIIHLPDVPDVSGDQKARSFVHNLPLNPDAKPFVHPPVYRQPTVDTHTEIPLYNPPNKTQTQEPSSFLLRKNLLLQSFQQHKFDDRPDRYIVWKTQFKHMVEEIKCSAIEQLTLLSNCIGKDSDAYRLVMSTRASCAVNPELCLQTIWNRMDTRFGSPELLESSLKSRLSNIPDFIDHKKLYELHDLLCEIQAVKNIERYHSIFSYLDSSLGIKPIVQKLVKPLQDKWITRAVNYKKQRNVLFPPFDEFVEFIQDISAIRNDPGLTYDTPKSKDSFQVRRFTNRDRPVVSARKVDLASDTKCNTIQCIIHKGSKHSINNCKAFQTRSLEERRRLLRENNICFRCCETSQHFAKRCDVSVQCSICKSTHHPTALHFNAESGQSSLSHGEERRTPTLNQIEVSAKCTELCAKFSGKSCARIVPVRVFLRGEPQNSLLTYAMLDDQSNKTLAKGLLFDSLGVKSTPVEYIMQSCTGKTVSHGRVADHLVVQDVTGKVKLDLPPVIECDTIPENRAEIPTPHVASHYPHMSDIAKHLQPLDRSLKILLLIGRDLPEAHHVIEQRTGPSRSPFAQRSPLGWTIIGDICLSGQHIPTSSSANKTFVSHSGRPSTLEPCQQIVNIQNTFVSCNKTVMTKPHIFETTSDDNNIGHSVEDRKFLDIMDQEFHLDDSVNKWIAPLPFRSPRDTLPDNYPQALFRAKSLDASLHKNEKKKEHFLTFMQKIFDAQHAELAPNIPTNRERWYLPLFGVYHPRKPDQIRGVFDSSAKFDGVSLNDQLLQGPDFINSLLGILIRFRKERVAVVADIESMFHSFLVEESCRDHLRFLWHKDNILENPLVTYRMRAHVFGNKPSPSIAMYGLQRIGKLAAVSHGHEVRDFIMNNFYVDDGLISCKTSQEAINLLTRTQHAMKVYGDIRLHKFASNCDTVLNALHTEDLAKSVVDLDLEKDTSTQRSLGLLWDLQSDTFRFEISSESKPYTRRGVLSTANSLYDPLGFIAPVTVQAKLILRKIVSSTSNWDEPLPDDLLKEWDEWKSTLPKLENLRISRQTVPNLGDAIQKELLVFCDASQLAIAAVCYLRTRYSNGSVLTGFVLGKTKVAPMSGHTIPRLELCAAVLAVDITHTVSDHLQLEVDDIKFYSDSRVVLGYINNDKKRFYIYVANRVAHIRSFSNPSQWHYIRSEMNPADVSTRGILPCNMENSRWLRGPESCDLSTNDSEVLFPLVKPDEDKEIRCMKIETKESQHVGLNYDFYSKFSSWNRLIKVVATVHRFAQRARQSNMTEIDLQKKAEQSIIKDIQNKVYFNEINCLRASKPLNRNSPIHKLDPYLDTEGLLRVGGRLKKSNLDTSFKHPVILPAKHHVVTLMVRKLHEDVKHQGRHFTEGHIRSSGYWIIGGKRLVSSIIFKCVICRRLRKDLDFQKMSNLPEDRIVPGQPPFSTVGVDMFGPWTIVTRRTRGGSVNSKRWAALFTCLATRAVHVEVVEEMTASSFINALRRFVAIRGKVNVFRSDKGTNFVGAAKELKLNVLNVEDEPLHSFLLRHKASWIFNPPHSSHMGGVWERMIGVIRRILDSMLLEYGSRSLTHEVLSTFLAEASSIINSRPLVSVSTDPESPFILTPSTLLTQKPSLQDSLCVTSDHLDKTNPLKDQWKRVQHLAAVFWKRWRVEYLNALQNRRKWNVTKRNVTTGDVVLVRDKGLSRYLWPMGIVIKTIPSEDKLVRKVIVRVIVNSEPKTYVRPVNELVVLIESD